MSPVTETSQAKHTLDKIVNAVGLYVACILAAYGIIYLCACPSPALAIALVAELVAFGVGLIIWKSNIFKIPKSIQSRIPESVSSLIEKSSAAATRLKCALLLVLATVISIDFAALAAGICGAYQVSATVYSAVPSSYWIGLHPAFTLEILSGAMVTNKEYKRAEPLYKTLLSIRQNVCGRNSDSVGAFYADFGDYYVRQSRLDIAEGWYRKSVSLGARTGRAYTALATVLREQGKFEESREYYVKALSLREKLFGSTSKQYQDTLRGYKALQKIQNSQQKHAAS